MLARFLFVAIVVLLASLTAGDVAAQSESGNFVIRRPSDVEENRPRSEPIVLASPTCLEVAQGFVGAPADYVTEIFNALVVEEESAEIPDDSSHVFFLVTDDDGTIVSAFCE
jgi:hypothetical protein